MKYDVIIVGAGFAGATLANKFANDNKKVLVIEKRPHIGGNMYEECRKNGVRVHLYGPHIFHTNDEEVFNYLKKFTADLRNSTYYPIIILSLDINLVNNLFTKSNSNSSSKLDSVEQTIFNLVCPSSSMVYAFFKTFKSISIGNLPRK